jgi:hypothetical protein
MFMLDKLSSRDGVMPPCLLFSSWFAVWNALNYQLTINVRGISRNCHGCPAVIHIYGTHFDRISFRLHVTWVPVTTAWRVLTLRLEETASCRARG